MRKTQINTGRTLQYKSVHLVGHADDVNVMGNSMQGVKEAMEVLDDVGKEDGLTLNATKTKILIQSMKNIDKTEIIKIGNKQINLVDKFKYLGVTLTLVKSFSIYMYL